MRGAERLWHCVCTLKSVFAGWQEALSQGARDETLELAHEMWSCFLPLQPFLLFRLGVYIQVNREKTLKWLWEHQREKYKEGFLELQATYLSFWGDPVGRSLKARNMVELDGSVLSCKPRNWWIYDPVIVTALPQSFCVIPGKLLKVSMTRIVSFKIYILKRSFKKEKKKPLLCWSWPACLYLHSNVSSTWFVHS